VVRIEVGRGEGMLLGLGREFNVLLLDGSLNNAVEILDTVAQLEIDSLKSLNVPVLSQIGCARLLLLGRARVLLLGRARLLHLGQFSLEFVFIHIGFIWYSLIESIVCCV